MFPPRGRGRGEVVALDGVDLVVARRVRPRSSAPRGAKSTLLRLIADLDLPTSGTVEVFGEDAAPGAA